MHQRLPVVSGQAEPAGDGRAAQRESGESSDQSGEDRRQAEQAESHEQAGGKGGGCIAKHESSLMHSKLVLFSKTKDDTGAPRSNVVWFGSANMTWATGAKSYNNTTTVYGDEKLYTQFRSQYFARLWSQEPLPRDDFQFASGASGITVFPSPDAKGDLASAAR